MEKSMELLESSRYINGGRERRAMFCSESSELMEKKRAIVEDRESYKYPLPPNGHLSTAVPGCGTVSL
jgi:hypothetical protein